MSGHRPASLAARRVRQTLGFANGARVLLALASTKTPWARQELKFVVGDGTTIACPNIPGARVPVYEVFAEDAYRLADLSSALPDQPVVLDIGGQVGCFTVALASRRVDVVVHAYEASPSTVDWLRRNVTDNGLASRVTVHPTAVSDHDGTLEFLDSGEGSALSGLGATSGTTVRVPCVTFASAMAAAGGRVDLVKIDTEGAEYDIVLGSAPDDWAGIGHVVLEYHAVTGHSWEELEQFFAEAGLTVARREPVTEDHGTAWLTRT